MFSAFAPKADLGSCAFGVDALLVLPKILLVLPKILEPIRRQCGVAHGRLDRSVSEIGLDCTSVLPIGGKLEAAPVTQHVAVDQKAKPGGLASAGNHPLITCYAEQRPTFRDEDIARGWGLPLQPAQCPAFPGRYRVHGRGAALGSPDMQAGGL